MLSLDQVRVATVKMAVPDGQMIELLKFHTHLNEQKPRDINNVGITHIAFEIDDLSDEYNRLKDEGVPFNSPPQLTPDGYAKVAFCRAPEGTFIELVEVL
jgi:catechol 2,3-dioxygenase-like lactoylglutathione lyase family enzyme